MDALHQRRGELHAKAGRIPNTIAEAGHSSILLTELQTIESEIAQVDQQLATCKPVDLNALLPDARKFETERLSDLRTFLRAMRKSPSPRS